MGRDCGLGTDPLSFVPTLLPSESNKALRQLESDITTSLPILGIVSRSGLITLGITSQWVLTLGTESGCNILQYCVCKHAAQSKRLSGKSNVQ